MIAEKLLDAKRKKIRPGHPGRLLIEFHSISKTRQSSYSMYRLASASASTGTQTLSASYTYEEDLLTTLPRVPVV